MRFPSFRSSSEWALYKVMLEIILNLKGLDLFQWIIFNTISMTLSTYFNVLFFSTIVINVDRGLKYLFLLIFFENLTSYCSLKQRVVKKTFVLNFLERFQTKLNERILSADWIKIKLSDQEDIRRKIDRASNSIQYLLDEFIDQFRRLWKLLMTIITISYISPISILFIVIVQIITYRFYLSKQSSNLLDSKVQILEKHNHLSSKYNRAKSNVFEYIIHHQKNDFIQLTNQLKIDMERKWFELSQLYDYLAFNEDIIGSISTFSMIWIYYLFNGTNTLIIPFYQNLSKLTDLIHSFIQTYIRWIKLIQDYHLLQPILQEYQSKRIFEQKDLQSNITIANLSFRNISKGREEFHLHLDSLLSFQMGETILIKGNSGAGKSTFYDILNGSISNENYSSDILIDNEQRTFHSIEKCRTMVLQDTSIDYRSSVYTIITDQDDDNDQQTQFDDSFLWTFLRLVQLEDLIEKDFQGNVHQPIENKVSGGQKTRLLLARALYRADQQNSSLLLLDEPDKGLPNETTISILQNIIKWYQKKGILFLTLHTEQVHQLDFDHILHIEQGYIIKIK